MPRRLALFAVVLATVSASSVFSMTSSVAVTSHADLCFGQVPTIVGTPGSFIGTPAIEGTEGVDVGCRAHRAGGRAPRRPLRGQWPLRVLEVGPHRPRPGCGLGGAGPDRRA